MKTKLLRTLEQTPKPTVRHFQIWTGKKYRHVAEPHEPLKSQLSEENEHILDLYERLLAKYGLEDIPQAYRRKHGVHTNAVRHKNNQIWFRFDFKSFYDTIRLEDFAEFIRPRYKDIHIRADEYTACFIDPATGGLTQGSPTSGTLAGIALIPFWLELKKAFPTATITQYSDDLCISGVDWMSQNEVQTAVIQCINRANLKVKLNTTKTRQDEAQYRCLTGVACNMDNQVTCYRKDYRLYRALLHSMKTNSVEATLISNRKTASQIIGKLVYMKHIDSTGKINKLIDSYTVEIAKLKELVITEQKARTYQKEVQQCQTGLIMN